MDQILAKCPMDSAEVLAFPLRNVINLSIKLSTFPEDCKVAKLKPILKKGARTDPKTTDLFHFYHYCQNYLKNKFTFNLKTTLIRKK